MTKRVKAKQWGDGLVFRKRRTRADGSTYLEDRYTLQYYVDGVMRREKTDCTDEAAAQKILDKRVSAIRAGEPVVLTRNIRLSDIEKRFFQDYEDKRRRSTVTAKGRWKNLAGFFDMDRKALSITLDELSAYGRQRVKDGASDSTVNRELAALKHGYRLALRAKVIAIMPSFPEQRKEPEPRQNFITPEQQAAIRIHLLKHEDGAAYADALDLSMLTGWRKGQVLHLRWENILKDEIRVAGDITKNETPHVIPIVPAIREILERRRAARVVGSPWVFARKDGKRIQDFEKAWTSACSAAGCAGTLYHDSRRSGVRNLIDKQVPQAVAMKISGHKTDAVFRRYNIVTTGDMRKALEAVSAVPVTPARKAFPNRSRKVVRLRRVGSK